MKKKNNSFIIGTSGWNYKEWKGEFYPEGLPQKSWLSFYQKTFKIVEINATFYRLFADSVFEKWRLQAKKDFKYIIKVPRIITHRKYLLNCKRMIKKFCRSVSLLDNKLALVLLQLPPNMPYDVKRLKNAILCFDHPKKVVVEFRNEKWYTDEVREMLQEIGCVFCAADSPKTRLCSWVTSKTAYIRLHGRKKWFDYKYSKNELREIADFAQEIKKKGAKKIYILFNNDYYAYAIKNATDLNKMLENDTRG